MEANKSPAFRTGFWALAGETPAALAIRANAPLGHYPEGCTDYNSLERVK
jgi:hypothetical protein